MPLDFAAYASLPPATVGLLRVGPVTHGIWDPRRTEAALATCSEDYAKAR